MPRSTGAGPLGGRAARHASGSASRAAPTDDRRSMRHLRVATYNIHKGVIRDLFGFRRVSRIHELRARLHELDADIVFLQEVQGRHARHAARFDGWPAEPQDEFLARSPVLLHSFESAYGRNANYLHGHHGNALLSRFPILTSENRDVSDHALEKRGILHCPVTIDDRTVHCFVAHFGLLANSRARQAQVLIDWIRHEVPQDAPLIIGGDFNDWRNRLSPQFCDRLGVAEVFDAVRPRRPVVERVTHFVRERIGEPAPDRDGLPPHGLTVRSARTYPALLPWLRMDRIYVRGFDVATARAPGGPRWAQLSDHSPLYADLLLLP